jgi:hypothetical protein
MCGRTALLLVAALLIAGPALSSPDSMRQVVSLPDTAGVATPDSSAAAQPEDRVVLYYFHRTARCENCLKFEAYADEAVRGAFKEELDDGLLEWRVVNLDDSTSVHFVDDYMLAQSSLVVSRVSEGKEIDWRNLDGIWYLVGNKDRFIEYVTYEVGEELKRLLDPRR